MHKTIKLNFELIGLPSGVDFYLKTPHQKESFVYGHFFKITLTTVHVKKISYYYLTTVGFFFIFLIAMLEHSWRNLALNNVDGLF